MWSRRSATPTRASNPTTVSSSGSSPPPRRRFSRTRSACTGSWWEPEVRRRTILGAGVSAAVTGSLIGCAPRNPAAARWRFFTLAEARMVDAICEVLIPADCDPGAKAAGVVHYIDIQLTKAFRKHQQTYRKGLAEVDATSRAKFGRTFVELSAGQQT